MQQRTCRTSQHYQTLSFIVHICSFSLHPFCPKGAHFSSGLLYCHISLPISSPLASLFHCLFFPPILSYFQFFSPFCVSLAYLIFSISSTTILSLRPALPCSSLSSSLLQPPFFIFLTYLRSLYPSLWTCRRALYAR